jgi:hypothetical protein
MDFVRLAESGKADSQRTPCPVQRLAIRYERRGDVHLAFLDLGCALVCFDTLQHLGSC